MEFPVKRAKRDEILIAIEGLKKRGYEQISDIVQIADGRPVEFEMDYMYSSFIVKMRGEKR